MAIVLPIHSHIGFSDRTEKDYERRCDNEENEGGERIGANEFMHNESQSESPGDDSRQRSLLRDEEEKNDKNSDCDSSKCDSSMNIDHVGQSQDGGSCDGLNEKANVLPLFSDILDDTDDVSDCNVLKNEEEKEVASSSVDNYWVEDTEIENEMPELSNESGHENENAENSSFLSSLKAVDIASSVNTTKPITIESEDQIDSNQFSVPNLFNPLAMVETNRMEVEPDDTNRVEDSTLIPDMDEAKTDSEAGSSESPLYGGLTNLGNTCYMASALQLLCGLDSFPSDLKTMIPPENTDDKDGNTNDYLKSKTLRESLLDVMDRLGNGETVSSYDLKRCIDSRTALFLGYRQQDSHEFFTTLMDMLDEDYKIKPKEDEKKTTVATTSNDEKEETSSDDDGNDADETIDNNSGKEILCNTNNEQLISSLESNDQESNDEKDFDGNDDDSDQESLESAQKRQKVVEEECFSQSENEISPLKVKENGDEPTNTGLFPRSKSYLDFKFSDIENLLHDKKDDSVSERIAATTTSSSLSVEARQDEPKCKLAGGRMSTSGVELTRFVDDDEIDENVRSTDTPLDRTTLHQQIVEGKHNDDEEEEDSDETSSNPISSNFTTKVRVCLTCESCKFRRSHIETFLHISLDIGTESNGSDNDSDGDSVLNLGPPSSSSIREGLRKFFAPEKRDIKCEKCFHNSALQTSEITQLPRNLLFHLKRFIVDVSPDYSSISYRKDQSSVIYEERIKLEDSDDDDDENENQHDDEEGCLKDFMSLDCSYSKGSAYEIRSVVNHIGSSASCGHYTADAKRLVRKRRSKDPTETGEATTSDNEDSRQETNEDDRCDEKDRQWTRFNDSYVSKISSKEAVKDASQTAYMIMYELVQ